MSGSRQFACNTSSPVAVFKAEGWTWLQLSLDASAGGQNQLGFDPAGMADVDPGDELSFFMAPGDELHVSATAGPVQWRLWYSDLQFIEYWTALFELLVLGEVHTKPRFGGFAKDAIRRFIR